MEQNYKIRKKNYKMGTKLQNREQMKLLNENKTSILGSTLRKLEKKLQNKGNFERCQHFKIKNETFKFTVFTMLLLPVSLYLYGYIYIIVQDFTRLMRSNVCGKQDTNAHN